MPLQDVSAQMKTDILNSFTALSIGSTAPQQNIMSSTFDYADDIVDGLKAAITTWAPTMVLSANATMAPGPVLHTIITFGNKNLIALKSTILANITLTYNAKRIAAGAGNEPSTLELIQTYLIDPISDAIDTVFTAYISSANGVFTIGTGVFTDPPTNSIVSVAYLPSIALGGVNFVQTTKSQIKALAVGNLGEDLNQNQQFLLAYYDAICQGISDVINSIPQALRLIAIINPLVGPTGSQVPNTFSGAIT